MVKEDFELIIVLAANNLMLPLEHLLWKVVILTSSPKVLMCVRCVRLLLGFGYGVH